MALFCTWTLYPHLVACSRRSAGLPWSTAMYTECRLAHIVGCSVYDGLAQPQPMPYTSISAATPAVSLQMETCDESCLRGLPLTQAKVPDQRPPCTKKSARERSGRTRTEITSSSSKLINQIVANRP